LNSLSTELISRALETKSLDTQIGTGLIILCRHILPQYHTNTTDQDAQQRERKKPKGQSAGYPANK
jgi:hypothetical protein